MHRGDGDNWNELKLPVICGGWNDISAVVHYINSFPREIWEVVVGSENLPEHYEVCRN